jgi:hypothetical protein
MIDRRRYRAGLLILAIALLIDGTVVYVRIWRVPKLIGPHAGAPGLLVATDSTLDPPCPSPLELAEPIETTVCDVVARRQDFVCRRVRLRATFESDCFEHSTLMGEGCDRGLVPVGSDYPGDEALFHAVCGFSSPGRPASAKKAATVTGILRPYGHGPRHVIALEIEKVEDIRPVKDSKDKHQRGAK